MVRSGPRIPRPFLAATSTGLGADTLALGAEAAAVVNGSRRTALLSWLRSYQARRAPDQGTNYALSATVGTPRGPAGTPGSPCWGIGRPRLEQRPVRIAPVALGGLAYARYYQETGDAVSPSIVSNLVSLVDLDMAEHDAATYHWFATIGDRPRLPSRTPTVT